LPGRIKILVLSFSAFWVLFFFAVSCSRQPSKAPSVDSALAYSLVKALVGFGPRPSGSENNFRQIDFIAETASKFGASVKVQKFAALTPCGEMQFANVIAEVKGQRPEFLIVGSHFDTKKLEDAPDFIGANDGASSTGLLLAMIKAIVDSGEMPPYSLRLVFFDGEECIVQYGQNDGLFGSRHYLESLKKNGSFKKCKAVIVLDMIGDEHLNLTLSRDTHPLLAKALFKSAERMGAEKYFNWGNACILDDHSPFQEAGTPAIDVIDFEYGQGNMYWHTKADTLDKLSPASLKVVGDSVLDMIWQIDDFMK